MDELTAAVVARCMNHIFTNGWNTSQWVDVEIAEQHLVRVMYAEELISRGLPPRDLGGWTNDHHREVRRWMRRRWS